MPRRVTFMHEEAREVLPRVLDAIGFRRGVLLGHSDGASIAAIYAGSVADHRIRGLVLLAPHFFAEEFGIAEIARMREAYETSDLRARLGKWHQDPDNAFHSWSGPWLDPAFRKWEITEELAYIRVPILIVQERGRSIRHAAADRGGQGGMQLPGGSRDPARDPARPASRGRGGHHGGYCRFCPAVADKMKRSVPNSESSFRGAPTARTRNP